MRIPSAFAVAFAVVVTAATSAGAVPFDLYNTGVDNAGATLPDGTTPDLHYTLTAPGDTNVTLVRTSAGGFPILPVGPYVGDDSLSTWIGPNNAHDLNGPPGLYTYQTTFDLTGFNPLTASITGQWTTDNEGRGILLNGVDTGTGNSIAFGSSGNYSFESWHTFTITGTITHPFLPGVNTLDFLIDNSTRDCGGDCSDNPTAVRVEMTASATVSSGATPLPAALPLFASGLGAMGFIGWRRKRKTVTRAA